ncbi:hypothetical protein LTR08_007133 [Meristemomyces frigidus]|nr:hypothetical protein LTR08_007133 [Meristemomyces frigidus]
MGNTVSKPCDANAKLIPQNTLMGLPDEILSKIVHFAVQNDESITLVTDSYGPSEDRNLAGYYQDKFLAPFENRCECKSGAEHRLGELPYGTAKLTPFGNVILSQCERKSGAKHILRELAYGKAKCNAGPKLLSIAKEEYYKANTFVISTQVVIESDAAPGEQPNPEDFGCETDDAWSNRKPVQHLVLNLDSLSNCCVEIDTELEPILGASEVIRILALPDRYPNLVSLTLVWKCWAPWPWTTEEDRVRFAPVDAWETRCKLVTLIEGLRKYLHKKQPSLKSLIVKFEQRPAPLQTLGFPCYPDNFYTGDPIEFDASNGQEVDPWEIMDLPSVSIKFLGKVSPRGEHYSSNRAFGSKTLD